MPGKEKLSAAGDKDDLGRGLPATAAGGWSAGPAGLGRTGARRPPPPSKPHPPPPPAGAGAEAGGVEEVDPADAGTRTRAPALAAGRLGGEDGEIHGRFRSERQLFVESWWSGGVCLVELWAVCGATSACYWAASAVGLLLLTTEQ